MNASVEETRRRTRYVVRGYVRGVFGAVDVSVCDLSETGLQLEHVTPLKPGTKARGAIQYRGTATPYDGVVTWCRLSTTANQDGKFLYRSGVRLEASEPTILTLVHTMTRDAEAMEDVASLDKKAAKLAARTQTREQAPTMRILPRVVVIPPDQLLLVEQARQRLRANPEEARHWYNRARYAMAEHAADLADSVFREEILAVWEYLERTVELRIVAHSFEKG